jgi:hypothetical protein
MIQPFALGPSMICCALLYTSVSQPVVRDDGTGGPQADLN